MSSVRPYPPELVGEEAYLDELDRQLEAGRFPDPDASLIPELTKARFVAEAARATEEHLFAERIDACRDPVFDPLMRFEVVATLTDEHRREQLDELVSEVDLPDTPSPEDDPEAFLSEAVSQRELTFFDYPVPPLHVIEAAVSEGRELIDGLSEERIESVPEQQAYLRQRVTVETIVAGARDLAASAYEDVIDRIRTESASDARYEDQDEYAGVIGFNAALAQNRCLKRMENSPQPYELIH